MPELLQRPIIESNAQILHDTAHHEQQYASSYAPRHAAEAVSLRNRITQSRLGRKIGASVAALAVAVTGVALEASPVAADSSQEYTIADTAAGGVYSRNSPSMKDTPRIDGKGIYPGDVVRLICGVTDGEPVGEKHYNTTWHKIVNLTRPEQGEFWENDRFFNTPNKAGELAPGEKNCNEASNNEQPTEKPKSNIKACYFNMKAPSKDLTFSYNGKNNGAFYGNAWQAAKNWSDTGAGISIKPSNNGNTYINFVDVDTPADWVAKADIPETTEWMGPRMSAQSVEHTRKRVDILINKRKMRELKGDKPGDFKRTYTLTHEVGHALGLGHTDQLCGYSETSIMDGGNPDTFKRAFNTPMPFDKQALKQLYE